MTDIGKILFFFGGSILYVRRLTYERANGRKSNKKNMLDVMNRMEKMELGMIKAETKQPKSKETTFHIKEGIVESAKDDVTLRDILYSNGVTLSFLESSIAASDKKWIHTCTSKNVLTNGDSQIKDKQAGQNLTESYLHSQANPLKRLLSRL